MTPIYKGYKKSTGKIDEEGKETKVILITDEEDKYSVIITWFRLINVYSSIHLPSISVNTSVCIVWIIPFDFLFCQHKFRIASIINPVNCVCSIIALEIDFTGHINMRLIDNWINSVLIYLLQFWQREEQEEEKSVGRSK